MAWKTAALVILLVAGLGARPAAAADPTEADTAALTAPVQKVVAALNHANPLWPADVFTRDAIALDDFPPFRWSGKTTARDWYKTLVGTTPQAQAAFRAMKLVVAIGAAAFPQISGDRAYVIFPTTVQYDEHGTRQQETGAWLIVEQKIHGGWFIAAHAWAMTSQGPAPN